MILTFIANQSEHPGLEFLHKWKDSNEWTNNVDGCNSLSFHEKKK